MDSEDIAMKVGETLDDLIGDLDLEDAIDACEATIVQIEGSTLEALREDLKSR